MRAGMAPAFWAARDPRPSGRHRAERRPHLRRAERPRQPARAGAAPPRVGRRRCRRPAVRQPGGVRRDVGGLQPRRVPADQRQLAPHARRVRLHRPRLPGPRLHRRRHPRRGRAAGRARGAAHRGRRRRWPGSSRGTTCSPPRTAPTSTTRRWAPPCSTRRAPPATRRASPSRPIPTATSPRGGVPVPRRQRAPLHRPAVPRRPVRHRARAAAQLRRAGRDDGALGRRGDPRASSRSTASRTCTSCRRCSTGCSRCPTRCATATTSRRCGPSSTAPRRVPVPVKQGIIEWFGPIVHEYYSATEGYGTGVDSPTWLTKPGTVGRADPDHLYVGDPDGSAAAGADEEGLVWIKATGKARFEYFGDEEKTGSAYRGDYFTLGDIGRVDDDGFLFLTDRSANLIISGGVNIYPAEIDAVLLTAPRGGRRRHHRRPRRRVGRVGARGRRAEAGRRSDGPRRGAARLLPRAPGRLQVPAGRRLRRPPAAGRERQALQAPPPRRVPRARRVDTPVLSGRT